MPPADRTLHRDEVHVWLVEQEMFHTTIPDLNLLLSEEEAKKAARFYFERDRKCFIIAHSLLRKLLASYTHVPPTQLCFSQNAYGKPALVSSPQGDLVSFNISHSHDLIIYAFTYARHVGIDVEYMRTNIEYEQLAKHYFSPAEHAELQSLPSSQRQQAFFQCWTRKEAYIKARGLGLSLPLASFDVTVQPGAPVKLLASREDARETTRWLFAPLPLDTHYAGTLVAEGQDWQMRLWQLSPHSI
jgi:4'-phosphopantetheinyl transferase